jgi:hypothetical protein
MDNFKSLELKLHQLKADKTAQEQAIKDTTKNLLNEYNPVQLAKNAISELAEDKHVQTDVTKLGINFGFSLLANKLVTKQKGIKGLVMTMLVTKISSFAIEQGAPYVLAGVSKFLHRNDEEVTSRPPLKG